MNILSELQTVLEPLGIPYETGFFSGVQPQKYLVLIPLSDRFALHGDNRPQIDIEEVRLSLYSKENYLRDKDALVRILLDADFTVTDKGYVGYENDTGYHHYHVDVAKHYDLEGDLHYGNNRS